VISFFDSVAVIRLVIVAINPVTLLVIVNQIVIKAFATIAINQVNLSVHDNDLMISKKVKLIRSFQVI
jgi:hypothetical protein